LKALSAAYAAKATAVTARWWLFLDQLLWRYADGYVHMTSGDELATPFGYPVTWLKGVGYDSIPEEQGAPCVGAKTPCSRYNIYIYVYLLVYIILQLYCGYT